MNSSLFWEEKMSSQKYLSSSDSSNPRLGDIEHLTQLSENLSALCMSHEYSDVILIVEGQKLHAHKVTFSSDVYYSKNYCHGKTTWSISML